MIMTRLMEVTMTMAMFQSGLRLSGLNIRLEIKTKVQPSFVNNWSNKPEARQKENQTRNEGRRKY